MVIGRSKKTPQRVRYSFVKILTGSDLSRRRLPFMSIESAEPGPVVWLTGCIHGDEVTGIVTIQEVFRAVKRQRLLRGSLYAFPLMNPIGFEAASRNITLSREDLNRCFPGDPNGSLAERIAERIFGTITETSPSLVLDLHNDWMKSIPHVLLDRHPGRAHQKAYGMAEDIAKTSGFVMIRETEPVTKSFSYSLLDRDIPALTLELGESNIVSEENVEYGRRSILGILARLGMLEKRQEAFAFETPEAVQGRVLAFSDRPVSAITGVTRFIAKPGEMVAQGQAVARIYNTFGKLQDTVRALGDGIVLGHSDSSVAFPGAPIMAFGMLPTKNDADAPSRK